MSMTHYMELLATNQPWNLLLFMAVPVILAETIAILELYLLFTRRMEGRARLVSRIAGIVAGIYFAGIIAYLIPHAVLPITQAGEWRTPVDVLAVGAYLLSGIPLVLIALQDMKLLDRRRPEASRMARHAVFVGAFLVLAHVAMIAGMLDPQVFGYAPPSMDGMADMPMH